jgi:hypothetical protein
VKLFAISGDKKGQAVGRLSPPRPDNLSIARLQAAGYRPGGLEAQEEPPADMACSL